ncbi:hypothetical protein SPRG_02625 [Saprolegnia parasitica CBS 223.65]|uniref:Amidohydrolase-related domain-containing protein n=1 Tax=Saprolegnia parasitica (strain CBS 223.65) TaxID=695850 RepID=A0A067D1M2_SAPPC|nr:hypothetical protein SPRG_02625 [Saprolegnia parasitica CBS 223.65]KDO32932.1 hypothetical protein SPRG_02625 [Saprolegnia parasitica CBS 223.65]|eukprot:XP_012196579.1 hypothetical protein SPRG_02625 [Saprolegnia parasitica CBS 223.65]
MGHSTPIADIVDCHHHYYDVDQPCYRFLQSLGASSYFPEQYAAATGDLPIRRTIHVDAMPDDGLGEVQWLESLIAAGRAPTLAGIVASCDLSQPDVETQLRAIVAASSRVRGVRFMLDYDGPFDGKNATHIACSRHNTDFLRDTNGAAERFARGYALLAKYNLSFDLQCCPAQLEAAAALAAKHPDVPVVIDHLGKLRRLALDGGADDAAKLAQWRAGMAAMAALPHVYVKLSMFGYMVPQWHTDAAKEAYLKTLVREVIALFGAHRCMINSNWHQNGAAADSDGLDATGPSMAELFAKVQSWVADYDETSQQHLFSLTAAAFYRV